MEPLLPQGFRVGHWSDPEGRTGCTVVLCPGGTAGGCDVRGYSPGSRELALLAPERSVQEVHALLLTGGSAFGLAAADGVMRYLEERGIGYETPWARVPIVPAAVIFDLNVGSASARPNQASGYAACIAAEEKLDRRGAVGAGTGATVGKWSGMQYSAPGGSGAGSVMLGDLLVTALAVVNAVGDVYDEAGVLIAGARDSAGAAIAGKGVETMAGFLQRKPPIRFTNTTLVAILTNASLSKLETHRIAQRGHDGLARTIRPVHTSFDGDVTFALAGGSVPSNPDVVAELAVEATARAVRDAVRIRT
jgi:L-aminopeptidase/D-esterase-like protein